MPLDQGRQRAAAVADGGGRMHEAHRDLAHPQAHAASEKPLRRRPARWSSPEIMAARLTPLVGQVFRRGRAGLFVRKADQHVDGRGREIPGLDHRDCRGGQPAAAVGRVHDAGEDHAVGAAADDGVEERVLARAVIAALAQHHLVALVGERVGKRLHGFQEHGARDGRARWRPPGGCGSRQARRPRGWARSRCAPRPPARAQGFPARPGRGVFSARETVIGDTPRCGPRPRG